MFVLMNDNGCYITRDNNGKYGFTTDKGKAEKWSEKDKAKRVRKNCLTKKQKDKNFRVMEIEDKPPTPKEEPKKSIIFDSDIEEIEINLETYDEDLSEILHNVSDINTIFTDMFSDLPNKLNILRHELSVTDREISDIHHWIELKSFNACEGYKAFALLKDKLRHRREVKDGIYILNVVNTAKNRKYTPRELNELF